jgi:hypothetical protein
MSNMPFIKNKIEVFETHTISKTEREIIRAKIKNPN